MCPAWPPTPCWRSFAVSRSRMMRPHPTWRREAIGLLGHSCLLTLGTFLVIFGGVALTLVVALRPPGKAVSVPNVVGVQVAEAKSTLAEAGLQAEVAGERHDESVPAGAVCMTLPTAGKQVREGRRVRLYVSKGPTSAVVPDLSGMTVEKARERLGQSSLRVGAVYQRSSRYVVGTVVGQRPEAKAKVVPGTEVDLDVSAGPDFGKVTLPDGTTMLCRTVVVQLAEGEGYQQVLVERKHKGMVDTLHDRAHRAGEKVEVDVLAEPGDQIRVYIDERKVMEQGL